MEKVREFQKNIYFGFIDYVKTFDYVDHNKLWKILKVMGIPGHLICLWEVCMQVKKQQLEVGMEQWTGSKSRKKYIKAVYCHPAYLTSMQSTSCEILGWMKHKIETQSHKIAGRNINNLRYADDTTLMAENEEN